MGKIISINISEKKGTVKKAVESANLIEDFGIEKDAHAGNWHRQVSLLSYESFIKFKEEVKIKMEPGVFGENLLVKGLNLKEVKVGDKIQIGEGLLEVTQIGKLCHKGCEIREIVGRCIMPDEGIFAKVLKGTEIKSGDEICLEHM
ncbi:MOSC domain-containing protein [Anaerosphaera multitolerans]|uniref:MOSC domain-containing protein n=1 Tax=Anaerosphaera multitolerans TaxID=2487351 RepID=A0A437S580_9FIRM|nr:MOSC domain-containing protein [Anaerosphaera multitolerans]RVU54127.1 MOSC domain-containing protein [Anaerosphaera multitolerans]